MKRREPTGLSLKISLLSGLEFPLNKQMQTQRHRERAAALAGKTSPVGEESELESNEQLVHTSFIHPSSYSFVKMAKVLALELMFN